jgi:hypothetical protein
VKCLMTRNEYGFRYTGDNPWMDFWMLDAGPGPKRSQTKITVLSSEMTTRGISLYQRQAAGEARRGRLANSREPQEGRFLGVGG